MYPKRATAHRRNSFVECRENPRLANSRCDVMSVHVGPKVRINTGEDDADFLARQIFEQMAYGLRGGVVYICDRARIDDEPADRRRRAIHEGVHFDGKAVSVCVKQIGIETINNEPRFCLLARCCDHWHPAAGSVRRKDHSVRAVTVAHMPEERKSDRHQDALLDADRDNRRRGGDGKIKLAWAFVANITQTLYVDHPEGDREDDAGQHAARQVLERAG